MPPSKFPDEPKEYALMQIKLAEGIGPEELMDKISENLSCDVILNKDNSALMGIFCEIKSEAELTKLLNGAAIIQKTEYLTARQKEERFSYIAPMTEPRSVDEILNKQQGEYLAKVANYSGVWSV